MFSHIMVGAKDIEESKIFYDKLLGVLGASEGVLSPNLTGQKRYFYAHDNSMFVITEPIDGNEATTGNGLTIAFNVKSEEEGNLWHQIGIENGGTTIEDPPGVRDYGEMKIYLAYLRDPSGNKLCAIKRM